MNEIHRQLQRQSDFNFGCLYCVWFDFWNGNGVDGVIGYIKKIVKNKSKLNKSKERFIQQLSEVKNAKSNFVVKKMIVNGVEYRFKDF